MKSSVNFGLISYNTHLFFPFPNIPHMPDLGPLFADSERKLAIDQEYLELVTPQSKSGTIQLAALQEVWYAPFADEITNDVASHGSYNNEFVNNRSKLPELNSSGLILLADPVCSFHDQTSFDYIKNCDVDGWDPQDLLTHKGFLCTKCDFPIDKDTTVSVGLFTTHMPTNYGKHPKSVTACFQALAQAVIAFKQQHQHKHGDKHPDQHTQYAVIVMGDLNVDKHSDKYQSLVADILLAPETGLKSAADQIDPGFSVNPQTNTLWQHFNPGKQSDQPTRIDYVLFSDSGDGVSQKVTLNSFKVKTDGLTVDYQGGTYNCSDHYPVEASITIDVLTLDEAREQAVSGKAQL